MKSAPRTHKAKNTVSDTFDLIGTELTCLATGRLRVARRESPEGFIKNVLGISRPVVDPISGDDLVFQSRAGTPINPKGGKSGTQAHRRLAQFHTRATLLTESASPSRRVKRFAATQDPRSLLLYPKVPTRMDVPISPLAAYTRCLRCARHA